MGSVESTTRTNGTKEKEDERQRASSCCTTAVKATVALAAVGMAAWSISNASTVGATMALAAVGAAVWSISKMVSENTAKDDETKMLGPRTGWTPPPVGRQEEKEERQRAAVGAAVGALAAVSVAAWGISKMVSKNTEKYDETKMMKKMNGFDNLLLEAQSGLPISIRELGYGVSSLESSSKTGWSPPPVGRFKMNTDASCSLHDQGQPAAGSYDHSPNNIKKGPTGFAGVLRNHRGEWVTAFHGFIKETDIFTAELNAIYYGLLLLDQLGIKDAYLESDCEPVVDWITKENNLINRRSPIIINCWDMIIDCKNLSIDNDIEVRYCSRDSNKLADKLAAMARKKKDEYKEITDIPAGHDIKFIVDQESIFT